MVDGTEDKSHYVYGGMWKNKHAGVSAKKPKKKDHTPLKDWSKARSEYITNDRVKHEGRLWICRRSHITTDQYSPGIGYRYWKEDASSQSTTDDAQVLVVDPANGI